MQDTHKNIIPIYVYGIYHNVTVTVTEELLKSQLFLAFITITKIH